MEVMKLAWRGKKNQLKKKVIKKGKSVILWPFVPDFTDDNLESFLRSSDGLEAEDASPNLKCFDQGQDHQCCKIIVCNLNQKSGDSMAAMYENEWYLTTVIGLSRMPLPVNV